MHAKRSAPAAERNKGPLLDVLSARLPPAARLLEIAAGTGQHAVHFARAQPHWTLIPTDLEQANVASIEEWRKDSGLTNILPGALLDVRDTPWPISAESDAVLCTNMIHISPWECTEALFEGAGGALTEEGQLFTYGPYTIGGHHTAPSNEDFDRWLRSQDSRFGVRDLADVVDAATRSGFELAERIEMPANNFTLRFSRR